MEEQIRNFVKKNKTIIGPAVFMLLSVFIALRVIIPLFASISSKNEEIRQKEQTVADTQTTIDSIRAINAQNAEDNISLLRTALPQNKDIILVYSTLVSVASENSMELLSFSVKVGEVFARDTTEAVDPGAVPAEPEDTSALAALPSLTVTAELSAENKDSLFSFSQKLAQALPLSNVSMIETEGNIGTYDISFFYKPLNPTTLTEQKIITPLTPEDQALLEQLRQYSRD